MLFISDCVLIGCCGLLTIFLYGNNSCRDYDCCETRSGGNSNDLEQQRLLDEKRKADDDDFYTRQAQAQQAIDESNAKWAQVQQEKFDSMRRMSNELEADSSRNAAFIATYYT